MAALPRAREIEVVDLNRLAAWELEEVLEEETRAWAAELHWNFRPSADLVNRYVGMRALDGLALLEQGRVVGYSYHVQEERKALIGDLFIRRAAHTPEREQSLLDAVLRSLCRNPTLHRVEAQLMMLGEAVKPPRTAGGPGEAFARCFMLAGLESAGRLKARESEGILFENWSARWVEAAGELISAVYHRHVDSRINDQYCSPAGARRFLHNIVHYPGCGQFHQPASWIALEAATGRLAGLCLATRVAAGTGHITQVCVAREWQGRGAGYEMLRRSLVALLYDGCREVSLTVTAGNEDAIALYERLGFRTIRVFRAFVWDGF